MAHVLNYYDLRPFDFDTGRRAPFDPDSAEFARDCDRCGARHARVFEVERDDGRVVAVGEACMRLAFTGLSEAEIKAARERAAQQHRVVLASSRADVQGLALRAIRNLPRYPTANLQSFSRRGGVVMVVSGCGGRRAADFDSDVEIPVAAADYDRLREAQRHGYPSVTAQTAPALWAVAVMRAAVSKVDAVWRTRTRKDAVTRDAAAQVVAGIIGRGESNWYAVVERLRQGGGLS